MKVLVFGGTTEGRLLARELSALGAPERLVENINTPDEYQALLHGKL